MAVKKNLAAVAAAAVVAIPIVLVLFVVMLLMAVSQDEENQQDQSATCTVSMEGGGDDGAIPEEYAELVDEAALEAGLPPETLGAQIDAESQWDPEAGSPAGAQGIAQFMPDTWKTYGEGGDIHDPNDAIPAMGRYMGALREEVQPIAGDDDPEELVRLTLAAYNAGPGAVQEYNGVPPYDETQNYVDKIVNGRGNFASQCSSSNKGGGQWDGDLGDGEWTNPLPGGQFTSGYGHRDISGVPEWAKDHMGVDISTGAGSGPGGDVLAPADMEIVEFYEPDACIKGKQKDEPQFYFNLCHLAENYVDEGDEVTRGDVIGVEGNTGQIGGMATHLHVEIFKPDSPSPPQPYNGHNIDPEPILKEKGAWPK